MTTNGTTGKGFLKVQGEDIVLDGKPILLKGKSVISASESTLIDLRPIAGAGLGGWSTTSPTNVQLDLTYTHSELRELHHWLSGPRIRSKGSSA